MAGGDAGEVEVITDPAEVAAAREAWRRWRAARLGELLARPSTIPYAEGFEILQDDPDRAFEPLVRLRDDASQPPQERLAAVLALTKLDVPPDARRVAEIATSPTGNAIWHFLVWVESLFPEGTPPPDEIRRTLKIALADRDRNNQEMAESLVERYGLSEFAPTLLKNARKGKSFRSLAKLHPTAEVLEFLLDGWRKWKGMEASHCVVGLIDFAAATGDEALRQRATEAFTEAITSAAPTEGALTYTSLVADVLPPDRAEKVLATVRTKARNADVREQARRQLRELAAAARAKTATIDPKMRAAFVRLGVIPQAEADRSGADVPEEQKSLVFAEDTPAVEVLARLGRYFFIERVAERIPYRHDFIIRDLGRRAAVPFRPEAVMETYRPLSTEPDPEHGVPGEYHTQFIHAGRLYRFAPPDLEYQYNVPAAIAAVNRALADAGVTDRFVALSWDSSAIEYLFAPPDALRAAAAELAFELNETEEG